MNLQEAQGRASQSAVVEAFANAVLREMAGLPKEQWSTISDRITAKVQEELRK